MSAKAASMSKPLSRLEKAGVKSPRVGKAQRSTTLVAVAPTPEVPTIVSSRIELIPFRDLKRAPENVRHIRKDEDIEPLADDIGAHGLLQSLIGYRAFDDTHKSFIERVWIVGGGRRLQALGILVDRGLISIDFLVPVLIRDRAEAVELSLTENLQKRDMSPVDECHAFVALMAAGTTSPLELAKRFGFSEIYVKQRLRLAELADPILDALADKKITLGSAMAYAASSDTALQLQVFEQQQRSSWEQHSPVRVKADYSAAQLTTNSPIFKFVGAETYERDGGTYEDDLFVSDQSAAGGRKLASGPILNAAALRMIEPQAIQLMSEICAKHPSIADVVIPPNLRSDSYPWKAPKAPSGHVMIEPDHSSQNSQDSIWKRIDNLAVAAIVVIGVNEQGELALRERTVFVPSDMAKKVKLAAPATGSSAYVPPTPEEIEKAAIARAIELKQWRLGVGSFAGTPIEGRVFWPSKDKWIEAVEVTRDPRLQDGRLVTLQVYVTNAEYDAMRDQAKQRVAEERAAAAEQERALAAAKLEREEIVAQLIKMDPPPAVLVFEEAGTYYRRVDEEWTDDLAELENETQGLFAGISDLIGHYADEAVTYYGSIEAYQATLTADVANEGEPA